MIPPMKDLTKQGYDLQFGTNVLGQFFNLKFFDDKLILLKRSFLFHEALASNSERNGQDVSLRNSANRHNIVISLSLAY